MYTLKILRALQGLLAKVKNGYEPETGICTALTFEGLLRKEVILVRTLMERSTLFSGHPKFPVPSPLPSMDAAAAYILLPKWRGDYGAARIRLLGWLVEEVIRTDSSLIDARVYLSALQGFRVDVVNGVKPPFGICGVTIANEFVGILRSYAFMTWPMYSGNLLFPVPSEGLEGLPTYRPQRAFRALDLWGGGYGERRRYLLDHTITYFEQHLKNWE